MPRFFFNFTGDGVEAADDLGCEFDSVEAAFVEAYHGMIGIGADMLLEREDPGDLAVDIVDESGEVLMALTYGEVCQRRPRYFSSTNETVRASTDIRRLLRLQVEKSRLLAAEVQSAFLRVRATAEAVHAAVTEAKSHSQSSRRGS